MANHATAKNEIDTKVYENQSGEITGEKLNSVLNQMLTSLGAGYRYGGRITTESSPNVGDENEIFFPIEVGEYANCGGLQLASDEIAIFKYNGTWSKESLLQRNILWVTEYDTVSDFVDSYSELTKFAMIVIDGIGKIIPNQTTIGWLVCYDAYDGAWKVGTYLPSDSSVGENFGFLIDYISDGATPIGGGGMKRVLHNVEDTLVSFEQGVYNLFKEPLEPTSYDFYFEPSTDENYEKFVLEFSTGRVAPSISWSGIDRWSGGEPSIVANHTYVVRVQNGLGVIEKF